MIQRYPNLFIVGAPKCGTTSLAYYLGQIAEIYAPEWKEPNFFCSDLHTEITPLNEREYLDIFSKWAGEKYALDASTAYFFSRAAPVNIAHACEQPKIIIMIRNPIEASYSLYWQQRYNLCEPLDTFEKTLEAEDYRHKTLHPLPNGFAEMQIYSRVFAFTENISNYMKTIGQQHVKTIVFDDFISDSRKCLDEILLFLDIKKDYEIVFDVKNPSKSIRSKRFAQLIDRPPKALSAIAKGLLTKSIKHKLRGRVIEMNTKFEKYPALKEETREQLVKKFAPEIESLSMLLDRDFSHWISFKP